MTLFSTVQIGHSFLNFLYYNEVMKTDFEGDAMRLAIIPS